MIDVVVLGLSAGLSFDSSLELYCSRATGTRCRGSSDTPFFPGGWAPSTRGEALERAASSLSVPQLARFGSVVCESLAFGSPLAETLERQAQVMRDEQRSLVEEEIERAPVETLVPLGTLDRAGDAAGDPGPAFGIRACYEVAAVRVGGDKDTEEGERTWVFCFKHALRAG